MNCPKCFAKMPDDAKFCTECGTALSAPVASDAKTDDAAEPAKAASNKKLAILVIATIVLLTAIIAVISIQEQARERRESFEREMRRRQKELDRQCPNADAHFEYINARKYHVLPCRNCGGRGCYFCQGTGWMKCMTCGGQGFVYR